MDPILPDYVDFASTIPHQKPKCRFISSVFGMTDKMEVTKWPQYWSDVTRKPVDFLAACQVEFLKDVDVFVEVGPHPVLCGLVAKNLPTSKTVPTLRRQADEVKVFSEALSFLYSTGCDVNWKKLYAPHSVTSIDLPFYQFNRKSYWLPKAEDSSSKTSAVSIHPFLGTHTWSSKDVHLFDAIIDLNKTSFAYLNDHAIGNTWVFPAAGHIEVALSAVKFIKRFPEDVVVALVVEDLKVPTPFGKPESDIVHMQTHATPTDSDKLDIEVFSTKDELTWTSHAICTAIAVPLARRTPRQQIKAIPEDLEATGMSEKYADLISRGFSLGQDFQRLTHYYRLSDTTTVFCVNLAGLDLSSYIMHPALIDAMVLSAFIVNDTNGFAITASIRKFTSYVPSIKSDCLWLYVTKEGNDNNSTTVRLVTNEEPSKTLAVLEGAEFVETSERNFLQNIRKGSITNVHDSLVLKQVWEKTSIAVMHEKHEFPNIPEVCLEVSKDVRTTWNVETSKEFLHLGELISLHYQKTLKLLGFQKTVGDVFSFDELFETLRVASEHRRYFHQIVKVLVEDGIFQKLDNSRLRVESHIPQEDFLDSAIAEKAKEIQSLQTELVTLQTVFQILPEILRGQRSALPILFPDEEDDTDSTAVSAVVYYNNSDLFRQVHSSMIQVLQNVLRGSGFSNEPLRILEVGGGTAAATVHLISLLESLDIPYHFQFTDVSAAFFPAAVERVKPLMTNEKGTFHTSVFDLEVDVLSQGFQPLNFDVILGSLVLHATKDIQQTCLNLRKVCRGFLCVLEFQRAQRQADAIFGSLPGLWNFQDDFRTDHTYVDAKTWSYVLESCGFSPSYVTNQSDDTLVLLGQTKDILEVTISKALSRNVFTWIFYVPSASFIPRSLQALSSTLSTLGRQVSVVGTPEDAVSLLKATRNLEGVLFISEGSKDISNPLKDVLQVIQNVFARETDVFPRVVVATTGAVYLEEYDDVVTLQPLQSSLWGLCRTLRSEYPGILVTTVDMDTADILPITCWLRKLFPGDHEPQVAYRGSDRHVLRLKDVTDSVTTSGTRLNYPRCPEFQVKLPISCVVEDLAIFPFTPKSLETSQVVLEVRAVGLNFEDVVCIIKPTSDFPHQNAFGLDVAGIVTSVGDDVDSSKVNVGDRVVLFTKDSPVSSTVVAEPHEVIRIPQQWTFEDGATAFVPFATAYHCLVSCAKITSDDTVLIHTASGAVGFAAIQVARLVRAKIVATARNKRKRAFLRSLGLPHVFDSHSVDFGAQIMKATDGRGVDVVLNSLKGEEFVENSLKACNANARFVELSVLNAWTSEEISRLRPDVAYFTVNLHDLRPVDFHSLTRKLEGLFKDNLLRPLPYIAFPISSAVTAIKFIQEGNHIGKVVLRMPNKTLSGEFVDRLFSEEGLYLITGGYGGIGLEVAKWMVTRGAKRLVLCGRHPEPQLVKETEQALRQLGAEVVEYAMFDVGDFKECREHILRVIKKHPTSPLRGIIHSAGVPSDADCVISNQTYGKFQETLHPKFQGALNLHQLSVDLNLQLECFVLFSSTAALLGHSGQASVTVANAAMDAVAWHRHSLGLPATSINWCVWKGLGIAGKLDTPGLHSLTTKSATQRLEDALLSQETQTCITGDLRHFQFASWARGNYLKDLLTIHPEKQKSLGTVKPEPTLKTFISPSNDSEDNKPGIQTFLELSIRSMLQMGSDEDIPVAQSLSQLGMDSLQTIQLNNKFIKDLKTLGVQSNFKLSNSDTLESAVTTVSNVLLDIRGERSDAA